MDNRKQSYSGGIGFCGLLSIAFIVLKLCGIINWSWFWVLSPVWIPFAFVVSYVFAAILTVFISGRK